MQPMATARRWIGAAIATGLVLIAASAHGQPMTFHAARPAPSPRTVVFVVRGLRSDEGHIIGALFDRPERWVRAGEETAQCRSHIHGGIARCSMAVPAGRYAFAFAHDENSNGQMDRDFLGIPREGYGFSNDVREPFGPPSFDAASFLPSAARASVVHIRYGI